MAGEKIRVLIVDDVAETRENVRKLLTFEADIEVVGAARSGRRRAASLPLHGLRRYAAYSRTLPQEDRRIRLSVSSNQQHQPWACPTPSSTFSP
mgnify:CR=1 FL=1